MLSRVTKYWTRRRSDGELNLVKIFKPLYIILLLLGLFPCSITFPKGRYTKIERKSIVINSICAFIMILGISGSFAYIIMGDRMSKSVSMSQVNYLIEDALLVTGTLGAYFCAYFYRNVYINMLNVVVLTWSEISNSDADHIMKQFRFLIWLFICGWMFVLIVGYMILSLLNKLSVLFIVTAIIPEMVLSGIVVFYNGMGLMVVSLLRNVDYQCGKLVKADEPDRIGPVTVKSREPQITLSQLELAYKKALEMKREINTAFQAVLLIITVQTFHTVLCEAHTLYHGVLKTKSFKALDILMAIHWILYHTLKMYALSFPGTMIENEETKLGQTLLCIPVENVQMFAEVQHFSSLMPYQETKMTAYGYFALDATLLFNTFAAVATYLVILVQFDA